MTDQLPPVLPPVDIDRAEAAIRELLAAIGEDPNREGLLETPRRVAKSYVELLSGYQEDPGRHLEKQFTIDHEEMVIVKEGTLKAHVNGKEIVVPAGGILFFASLQPHAVTNIGDTPATYFVINWASPGSKKK